MELNVGPKYWLEHDIEIPNVWRWNINGRPHPNQRGKFESWEPQ